MGYSRASGFHMALSSGQEITYRVLSVLVSFGAKVRRVGVDFVTYLYRQCAYNRSNNATDLSAKGSHNILQQLEVHRHFAGYVEERVAEKSTL